MDAERWLRRAVELAVRAVESGSGGPFGAVVVRAGTVVGEGWNRVLETNDPTAHAEVVAIRAACAALGTFDLAGCEVYASCEPCPMCHAAALWARVERVVYAGTREDAAAAGFDDARFHAELAAAPAQRSLPLLADDRSLARPAFEAWLRRADRRAY